MVIRKNWCFKSLISAILVAGLSGCASTQTTATNPDPFHTFNRHTFRMNETLDKNILKPIAKGYNKILPSPVRKSITNFFSNINEIPTIGNDLLQVNFYNAIHDTWRFAINTTAGVGGLFDVASDIGLGPHRTDFGLTLAKWGYKQSAYFVIPFLGPSTIRDTLGLGVDSYGFGVPWWYAPIYVSVSANVLDLINRRAQLLKSQGLINQLSFDPYIFQRNAYLQYRAYQIKNVDDRAK